MCFLFLNRSSLLFIEMALMKSIIADDEKLQENLEYYVMRIIKANEMKKMCNVRLYLVKARNAKQSYLSHVKDTPQNIQVTKLEIGLMEAVETLQKVVMDRQLLHIALQKCIQSTMLYVSQKCLFGSTRLNYIERYVAKQMKDMLVTSDKLCELKEVYDKQVNDIFNNENALNGRIVYQQNRIKQTHNLNIVESRKNQCSALHKKIHDINNLRIIIGILVSRNCKYLGTENGKKIINEAIKWRTPRSFTYYKNLCSGRGN